MRGDSLDPPAGPLPAEHGDARGPGGAEDAPRPAAVLYVLRVHTRSYIYVYIYIYISCISCDYSCLVLCQLYRPRHDAARGGPPDGIRNPRPRPQKSCKLEFLTNIQTILLNG